MTKDEMLTGKFITAGRGITRPIQDDRYEMLNTLLGHIEANGGSLAYITAKALIERPRFVIYALKNKWLRVA